jgi:tetratricopeptide (TPR) repeat protein
MSCRLNLRLLLLAAVFGWLAPFSFTQDAKSAKDAAKHVNDGHHARQHGDFGKAIDNYTKARDAFKKQGLPHQEANAALHLGETLQDQAKHQPADKGSLQQRAEQQFKDAIRLGSPPVKALAQNNLGVVYLEQKDGAKKAIQVFESMQLDHADLKPTQRAIYLYNRGRAYEQDGRLEDAGQVYQQAVRLHPRYKPAADGAFRLLLEQPDPAGKKARAAIALANDLQEKGHGDVAAGQISTALRSRPHPDAGRLLAVVVRYYASVAMTPDAYAAGQRESQRAIAERQEPIKRAVHEIDRAFVGGFPASFKLSDARTSFPFWSNAPDRKDFIALLRTTGDFYYRATANKRDPEKALAHYAAAFALDPADTGTALAAAAVLRDFPDIDKDRQIHQRFVEALMDEKYERYRHPPTTAPGWDNLARLHSLLGSLFEKDGKWGPEGEVRTAMFQWKRAEEAEKQYRALLVTDVLPPRSPILQENLGGAYEHEKKAGAAWDSYVNAAEGFAQLKNRTAAKKALSRAKKLGIDPSNAQIARLREVEKAIEK